MNRQGYDVDLEDDDLYPQRTPSSARRYRPVEERDAQQQQQHRRTVAQVRPSQQHLRRPDRYDNVHVYVRRTSAPRPVQTPRHTVSVQDEDDEQQTEPLRSTAASPITPQPQRWRFHWLVYVGVGMLVTLVLWVSVSGFLNWWGTTQDDWHYGRPRTAQYDVKVGHNDTLTPSHFLALNLNRHIEIIEFPGGDVTKAKVYMGPTLFGDHEDVTPVTLEFKALKSDGKLDMIVHVGANKVVFINDNGQFRPVQPGDNITTV
jgi:hypothetical protein